MGRETESHDVVLSEEQEAFVAPPGAVAIEEEEDDLAVRAALALGELLDEMMAPLVEGASRHAAGLVTHDLDAAGRGAVLFVETLHHLGRELPIGRVLATVDDEGARCAIEEHTGTLGVWNAHPAVTARRKGACAMWEPVAIVPLRDCKAATKRAIRLELGPEASPRRFLGGRNAMR